MIVDDKYTSNELETAVRIAPAHNSSSCIIVNDVCAYLLHSIWRPQDIDL